MKGEIVLDTLITAITMAAAAAIILGSFVELQSLVLKGIERERARGTASVLSEWGRGCSIQDVNIDFPYEINIVCLHSTPYVAGGGKIYRIEGVKCSSSTIGMDVEIYGCEIRAS